MVATKRATARSRSTGARWLALCRVEQASAVDALEAVQAFALAMDEVVGRRGSSQLTPVCVRVLPSGRFMSRCRMY